jgi:hypothetical protein
MENISKRLGQHHKLLSCASQIQISMRQEEKVEVVTRAELKTLKFHFGTSSWGGTRKLPTAFTEQGIAMLSGVLRSKRAIQTNIAIMRAFVKLRQLAAGHKELATKLEQLERKIGGHDDQIQSLFEAIRQLMEPPVPKSHRIGSST